MTLDLVNYVNMNIQKIADQQDVQNGKQYRETAPYAAAINHMNYRRQSQMVEDDCVHKKYRNQCIENKAPKI